MNWQITKSQNTGRRQNKTNTVQETKKMRNSKMLDFTIRKHTQKLSYKELGVKTNRTSFIAEIASDTTTQN